MRQALHAMMLRIKHEKKTSQTIKTHHRDMMTISTARKASRRAGTFNFSSHETSTLYYVCRILTTYFRIHTVLATPDVTV